MCEFCLLLNHGISLVCLCVNVWMCAQNVDLFNRRNMVGKKIAKFLLFVRLFVRFYVCTYFSLPRLQYIADSLSLAFFLFPSFFLSCLVSLLLAFTFRIFVYSVNSNFYLFHIVIYVWHTFIFWTIFGAHVHGLFRLSIAKKTKKKNCACVRRHFLASTSNSSFHSHLITHSLTHSLSLSLSFDLIRSPTCSLLLYRYTPYNTLCDA